MPRRRTHSFIHNGEKLLLYIYQVPSFPELSHLKTALFSYCHELMLPSHPKHATMFIISKSD